jgi:hypothetical protein
VAGEPRGDAVSGGLARGCLFALVIMFALVVAVVVAMLALAYLGAPA